MTSPSADSCAGRDGLAVAVMALHAAVDGWAAAIVAAADAHPEAPERAVEEAALRLAEDAYDDALDGFTDTAADVLGFPDQGSHDDEDDEGELETLGDPAEAVGVQLYATVLGTSDSDPLLVMDAEGEKLVAALEAVGYEVPEWGVSLVPVEGLAADDADEGDEGDEPEEGERT